MTPGLLLPAGLLALVGVLVPLLIHLIRRSEMEVTDFAALRWLTAKARPRRRLRFDERLLLAVRLLLIALIAVLLAQPVLTGWPSARDWLVVVPGADLAELPAPDVGQPAERRWLAPGLPALDAPVPAAPVPAAGSTASLLRELDARLAPDSAITVLVPTELAGLDGERPRLSRPVRWRVSDGAAAPAVRPVMPVAAEALGLWVAYAPERAAELRYLRAAAVAAVTGGDVSTDVGMPDVSVSDQATAEPATAGPALEILDEIALPGELSAVDWPAFGAGWLIWLSDQPLPPAVMDWVAEGGQVLRVGAVDAASDGDPVTVWRGDGSGSEVRAFARGRGRLLELEARLVPELLPELLEPDLPDRLRGWLASPGPEPSRAPAESHAPDIGLATWPPPVRGLGDWLVFLIVWVFLLERWLASRPGRLP